MMFNRKISTVVSFFVLFLVSASFAGEHFVPITSYRTGPYGVNGYELVILNCELTTL